MEEKKKTTAIHATETVREVRGMVKRMYSRPYEAREKGNKVAWVMYGVPGTITGAFDVARIYPENYAGLCGAKKAEGPFIERAEAEGFANTICSYGRTGLGHAIMRQELGMIPPDAPDGGMLDPDMALDSA